MQFGTGKLIAVPKYDINGAAIAVPQPVILGTLQEVSLDIAVEVKTLHGSKRYAIAAALGKGKIELKAKHAEISSGILGSLFFGKDSSAGIKSAVIDPAAVAIPATPFQITVTPPSSGTWVEDLGVYNTTTGAQMTRVDSAPETGEYNVADGTYTFSSADADDLVKIGYEYSVATGGQIWTIDNAMMGNSPSFSVILKNGFDGQNLVCKLNRCHSGKLNLPFKSDDFAIHDFEAEAIEDAAGDIGYMCLY